jgi:hypothetical protein
LASDVVACDNGQDGYADETGEKQVVHICVSTFWLVVVYMK